MDAIIGTGKISKREYGIIGEHNVSVKMSDGVNIYVDIFRPDKDGRFPVLFSMSPFNKEIQSDYVWPAPTRSQRIRGIPDACIEATYND